MSEKYNFFWLIQYRPLDDPWPKKYELKCKFSWKLSVRNQTSDSLSVCPSGITGRRKLTNFLTLLNFLNHGMSWFSIICVCLLWIMFGRNTKLVFSTKHDKSCTVYAYRNNCQLLWNKAWIEVRRIERMTMFLCSNAAVEHDNYCPLLKHLHRYSLIYSLGQSLPQSFSY